MSANYRVYHSVIPEWGFCCVTYTDTDISLPISVPKNEYSNTLDQLPIIIVLSFNIIAFVFTFVSTGCRYAFSAGMRGEMTKIVSMHRIQTWQKYMDQYFYKSENQIITATHKSISIGIPPQYPTTTHLHKQWLVLTSNLLF